jgi:hypothetical protein
VTASADFKWTNADPISNGGAFSGISCSPSGFCAAVNGNGDVVTSPDPAGGPSTWTTTGIASDTGLDSVSCPTAQFCAATDGFSGDILVSSDPGGGPGAWQSFTVPTGPDGGVLSAVDCASSSFCVAVDGGDVVTSTDPTGGQSAWVLTDVAPGNTLNDVSCVGNSLCVAVGSVLSTSTDPTGGTSAWRTSTAVAGDAVSCPAKTLCVLTGDNGDVHVSTDPTGGPAAYSEVYIDSLHPLQPSQSVSCVGGVCVVVGASGDAITTLDPTGHASDWEAKTIDAVSGLVGVSCVSSDLCVAVDGSGDALVGSR